MKEEKILSVLKSIPLFSGTDTEQLQKLLHSPGCRVLCTTADSDVAQSNEKCLTVLLEGRVQIRSTDGERNVILRTPGPGEVLGAASLFLRDEHSLSRITALGKCTVMLIDLPTVLELLREDTHFLEAYLSFLAGRVQFLNQKIRCFTAGSAERRLALWLVSEGCDTLTLPVSVSALAETLDIGRASLYRALDKLQAEGLIRHEGRTITLLSREKILEIYQ